MKPLFSDSGLKILESLSFTKSLYAFDFDGTLSRIVSSPSEANISATTSALLKELSRVAPVAIISGRSLQDLKSRLPFCPPFLIGNHGLEGLGLKRESMDQARKTCASWKKMLEAELKWFGDPGLEIEDKGFSLAIHYRRCISRRRMKNEIFALLPSLRPSARVIPGKCVVNLVPYGTPHKGMALTDLMDKAGIRSALYVGDDDTDEDVFSLPDPRILTVRIGRKNSSNAMYWMNNQSQINPLLKTLIEFHQPSSTQKARSSQNARP